MSIDGIISIKNSSRNRFILRSSCQENNRGLDSIHINTSNQYYFHISIQSSSNSFSSLLPLSYCEHQQTTYYSSSGFSILRSSPRFLFTRIDKSEQTSSFYHHHHHHNHNGVLSIVNQTLSTPIVTLMSSNENKLFLGSDYNNTTTTKTTTVNSLLSTTTTISNVSLIHTSLATLPQRTNRTYNLALLSGCIGASIIILVILIYAFIKYRNRDEGSYKIDESKNFVTNSHLENNDQTGCGGKLSSSTHHRQKLLTTNEQNGIDSREWYV